MVFTLKPNPGLYAKLAAQWEAEEVRRQEQASRHISIDWTTYHQLIFIMIFMLLLHIAMCTYRFYITKRRQARRQFFAQEGKDVEDVVAVLWAEDEKVLISMDDETRTTRPDDLKQRDTNII